MSDNRVVQGRMQTPESLAELIEGEDVMDAEPIEDADDDCPECGENVISVGICPLRWSLLLDTSAKSATGPTPTATERRLPIEIPLMRVGLRRSAGSWPSPGRRLTPEATRLGRHFELIY